MHNFCLEDSYAIAIMQSMKLIEVMAFEGYVYIVQCDTGPTVHTLVLIVSHFLNHFLLSVISCDNESKYCHSNRIKTNNRPPESVGHKLVPSDSVQALRYSNFAPFFPNDASAVH